MNSEKTNLDQYLSHVIRIKARKLVRGYAIPGSDQEDIEQDLALHLVQHMTSFDPRRSSTATFVNRILDRKVISMLRYRFALRRDTRKVVSLEQHNDEGPCLPVQEPDAQVESDLSVDLQQVLTSLDDESRRLCQLLMRHPLSESATKLGLTRAQARTRVAQIRKRFETWGLNECST